MFGLGTKEVVIVVCIIIVLFGSSRIPVLTKNLAEAVRQIKGIFGRVERKEIVTAEENLKVKTKYILNQYGRSKDVIEFARLVRDLLGNSWNK